jgi:hypothetical protein
MSWVVELERLQADALYHGEKLLAFLIGMAVSEARRIAREKRARLPQSGDLVEAPT